MKLLEIIPLLKDYTRIHRKEWAYFLIRPASNYDALVKLDLYSLQIGYYMLTYDDLMANDWEVIS